MKRIILLVLFIGFGTLLFAQSQVLYNTSPTLVWDAVTVDGNGDPWLPEDVVEYEIYFWDSANGDATVQLLTDLTHFATTSATELQLTFPYRANWAVGVRTKHTDGGGNVVYSADLAWTIVLEDIDSTGSPGSPFVYAPLQGQPEKPDNLRDSGT
jgi:hypothetical protein